MTESAIPSRSPPESAADEHVGRLLNEYLERHKQGESISEELVRAEHPALASILAQHLRLVQALATGSDPIQELLFKRMLSPPRSAEFVAELGHYRIQGVIGRGGMGVVLRAIEEPLGRPVALKILRPELAVDHRALVRFEHEAKAAAALRHPNIVTVYACGAIGGTHYLAMEAIEGPSLAERLMQAPALSNEEAGRVFLELMRGLQAAHRIGLVHRDIKPSNLLLDGPDRQVKIADFGLARIAALTTRITQPLAAIGTPEYMSPEQARGDEEIDHRADLYAGGVVLYEMLTGRIPFKADTASAVIHAILNTEPSDPFSIRRQVDPRLASMALRLMAKRREDRLGTASEVIDVLCDGRLTGPRRQTRPRLRSAKICVAAGIVTVALAYLGLLKWGRIGQLSTLASGPVISDAWVDPNRDTSRKVIRARYGDDPSDRVFLDLSQRQEFANWDSRVEAAVAVDPLATGRPFVLAAMDGPVGYRGLLAFDAIGKKKWDLDLSNRISWPDCDDPGHWLGLNVVKLDPGGRQVVVVSSDVREYPTRVDVVDAATGSSLRTFYHLGDLYELAIMPDFFGAGRPAIAAAGVNNKLDGFKAHQEGDDPQRADFEYVAVVMILDPETMSGLGPPRTARLPELQRARPYAYAYLNVSALSGVLRILVYPGLGGGTVEVIVDDRSQEA